MMLKRHVAQPIVVDTKDTIGKLLFGSFGVKMTSLFLKQPVVLIITYLLCVCGSTLSSVAFVSGIDHKLMILVVFTFPFVCISYLVLNRKLALLLIEMFDIQYSIANIVVLTAVYIVVAGADVYSFIYMILIGIAMGW